MIRIGTIGTSAICESFIQGMRLTKKYELAAVYSRSVATGRDFADQVGCKKVFTDLNEMAEWEGIDAVYIASPNSMHVGQSELFLKNNKHVICEKPIVTNAHEYIELKRLADKNKLIYMEAIIPRHTAKYPEVKNAVKGLGKILSARIDFSQRSSRIDAFKRGEQVNIFDMSLYAGTLMDIGVYCVYAAVDFFGKPKSIIADANFLENRADGSGTAVFKYDGFSAILTYNKTCQGVLGSEIIGENGAVKIKHISQYAGVKVIGNDAGCNELVGMVSKAELMSGEANRFADYMLNLGKEDYDAASDLCLCVHQCMDEIKNKAKIIYS